MTHGNRPPRPTEVRRLAEQGLVRITWSDGHVSEYPLAFLRGWCPCAACQGHGGERHFISVSNPELVGIQPVGSYALTFAWAGGHDTGIYSYGYLRDLCPCPICASRTGSEPAA